MGEKVLDLLHGDFGQFGIIFDLIVALRQSPTWHRDDLFITAEFVSAGVPMHVGDRCSEAPLGQRGLLPLAPFFCLVELSMHQPSAE